MRQSLFLLETVSRSPGPEQSIKEYKVGGEREQEYKGTERQDRTLMTDATNELVNCVYNRKPVKGLSQGCLL
jgi:hypothetical protein